MPALEFTATLSAEGPNGAWTVLYFTKEQAAKFGVRGPARVVGTLNGFAIRTTAFPTGDGSHHVMVNKLMQAGAGVKAGDIVTVALDVDTKPRVVKLPADVRKALVGAAKARAVFTKLAYSHQKEYVTWITSAKQVETRAKRIAEAVRLLAAGIKYKDR